MVGNLKVLCFSFLFVCLHIEGRGSKRGNAQRKRTEITTYKTLNLMPFTKQCCRFRQSLGIL